MKGISEWWLGKDSEGSGNGLILRYYPSICLEGLRKTMKNLSLVHLSQGMRYHADSCRALRWWQQCHKQSLRGTWQQLFHSRRFCISRNHYCNIRMFVCMCVCACLNFVEKKIKRKIKAQKRFIASVENRQQNFIYNLYLNPSVILAHWKQHFSSGWQRT
jgi:hypothetical protein